MTDDFDPYYTWLGIPPEEQPANYYRLLGVRQFEPSLEVISNAGDQRMAFLRTFQIGNRSALSQRLLNEIAGAKVCLLDPDQRRVYDQKLKSSTTATKRVQPAPDPRQAGDWQVHDTPLVYVTDDVPLDADGNGSNPITSWFKDTFHRFQNVPRRTVAYGGLVLGAMLLMSPLLWIALGGNRRPPAVAKVSTPAETNPAPEVNPTLATTEPPSEDSAKKSSTGTPTAPAADAPTESLPAFSPPAVLEAEDVPPMSAGKAGGSSPIVDYSPLVQVVPGRFRLPYQIQMSPSGRRMIFWRPDDSKLHLFRVEDETPVEYSAPAISCAAVSDNGILACGTDKLLMVWSIPSTVLLWSASIPGPAREIAVSADGAKVAVLCDADKPIAVFSIQDRRALGPYDIGNSRLSSVAVTNLRAAFIIDHAAIGVMDVSTGTLESILQHPQASVFRQVCFNGPLLCASDDQSIFWMGEPGMGMKTWTSKRRPPGARIVWHSPSSGLIAMVHKGTITLVKSPEDEIHSSVVWPDGDFLTVAFALWGNKRMVTRGPTDSLLVWDLDRLRGKSTQTMYSPTELAAWKPGLSNRSPPMPVVSRPRTEPLSPPIAPPKPAPDYGPLEKVEPAAALAALRDLGVSNLPNDPEQVKSISLYGSRVTDADCKYIAPFKNLDSLGCEGLPITGKGLRYFQGLTQLRMLFLNRTAIQDEDLALISGLTNLNTLYLVDTSVTAQGIAHLKDLKSLQTLVLPPVGKEALPTICGLTELVNLVPFPADINDEDLELLSRLTHLARLDLQQAKPTLQGYERLKNFREVRMLNLAHDVPREALAYFSGMRLTDFSFPPTARDEDVSTLERIPTLTNVVLNENMTDDAVARVARYPRLDSLVLSSCSNITDEGIQALRDAVSLEHVYAPPGMGNEGLRPLAQLPKLKHLHLHPDCGVTDDGLVALTENPKLEMLTVSSRITDGGCDMIAKIKTLRALSFNKSQVGGEGLKKLKELSTLQSLALRNVSVNKEGVDALKMLSQVRSMNLLTTDITPEWEAELRAALPKTNFFISKYN